MTFLDPEFFFYFLPAILILHRLVLAVSQSWQYPRPAMLLLIFGTLFFYGYRVPWWIAPFVLTATLDYLWANLIGRNSRLTHRRFFLSLSVIQNIGVLCIFKYHPRFGVGVMPAGLSFYTFESLSYVIDVYRRDVKPSRDPLPLFAFLATFPRFVTPNETLSFLARLPDRIAKRDLASPQMRRP